MKSSKIEKYLQQGNVLYITLVLLLISAIIAGLIAVVNVITEPKILQNKEQEKNDAIAAIFGDDAECTQVQRDLEGTPVTEVYEVCSDDKSLLGYCVFATGTGFGGDIEIILGTDTQGNILNVSVLEMSETAGLGSRIGNLDYLEQYQGKSYGLEYNDIDGFAGSTISCKAIFNTIEASIAPDILFGEGGENSAS